MLIDAFIRDMLLDVSGDALTEAIARARESLREYEFDIYQFTTVIGESHITLSSNVVDVFSVAYDRRILTRASEAVLDANSLNWRTASEDVPQSWLWRGEVPNGQVRLHPPPDDELAVHVLAAWQPNLDQLLPWQTLYVALHAINALATSDPLRARPPLGEFASVLLKTYKDAL